MKDYRKVPTETCPQIESVLYGSQFRVKYRLEGDRFLPERRQLEIENKDIRGEICVCLLSK